MERIGKVYIDVSVMMSDKFSRGISDMLHYMGFIPLRAETMVYRNQIELVGLSPMFEEASIYHHIPEYNLILMFSPDDDEIELDFMLERM